MNERTVQALIRLVVAFVTAGIGALLANTEPILDLLGPSLGDLTMPIITAVLLAVVKAIGGPTVPAPAPALEGARGIAGTTRDIKRPNPFAV